MELKVFDMILIVRSYRFCYIFLFREEGRFYSSFLLTHILGLLTSGIINLDILDCYLCFIMRILCVLEVMSFACSLLSTVRFPFFLKSQILIKIVCLALSNCLHWIIVIEKVGSSRVISGDRTSVYYLAGWDSLLRPGQLENVQTSQSRETILETADPFREQYLLCRANQVGNKHWDPEDDSLGGVEEFGRFKVPLDSFHPSRHNL